MNAWLAMPLSVRLAVLTVIGLVVGCFVNLGIYSLAWFSRPISPWQQRHPKAPPRRWPDFLPILGWFGLSRESSLHGRGFWIRPLLIELACGAGLPVLYWWEISGRLAPPLVAVIPPTVPALHHQFVSHAILMALMLVATFIDFDEKTIPDEITVPGTLIGLLLAAWWPDSHLPVARLAPEGVQAYLPLLFTSTSAWPPWLNDIGGLLLALAIFVAWCVVLIPALCTLRRGWWKAIQFYFASMARGSAWWKMLLLAALGSAAITAVWRGDGNAWKALLTALIGVAFGGGLIWAVRIGAGVALGKEAMGFGDVTLLAMIGAFLGWQACLMIFAISPCAALVIAVAQLIATGRRDIPYGPYLCASAIVVILGWPWFWQNFSVYFAMGWLVPGTLASCFVLMIALLTAWRMIERMLWP